jgi:hypothetical protein
MYRVGFGDAFLLTFDYRRALPDGRRHRHVLIDCGSTRADPAGPDIADIARLIAEHSGGVLDVLVVTHRHADHLSAFGSDAAARIMDTIKPKLVVRPWTDDPAAAMDATSPAGLDAMSRRFAVSLAAGQDTAAVIGRVLERADRRSLRGELAGLASDQIPNFEAVQRLVGYAAAAEAAYVSFGDDTGIAEFVPGVDVDVLGPPTLAQWPILSRQRDEDDEFWMLHRELVNQDLAPADAAAADPTRWAALLDDNGVGPARWLLERLDDQRVASLLRIVRTFDSALNNTSLILLFKTGDRRLLFSGDAQIENWSYVLTSPDVADAVRAQLNRIDLYKVGHHGSRNATPKSLFALWNAPHARNHPMTTLLSTLPGVHGRRDSTAVPRATLVTALRHRTNLLATDELPPEQTHIHVSASTRGDAAFTQA